MLTYLLDDDSQSMYVQLYRHIRDDIEREWIRPGQKLPSKREFAAHLGVSAITVQHAYDQLMSEGYIESAPKSGYFALSVGNVHPVDESVGIEDGTRPAEGDSPLSERPTRHGQEDRCVGDGDAVQRPIDLQPNSNPLSDTSHAEWMSTMRKVAKQADDADRMHAECIFLDALVQHLASTRKINVIVGQIVVSANVFDLLGRIGRTIGAYAQSKRQSESADLDDAWHMEGYAPSFHNGLHAQGIATRNARIDRIGIDPGALPDDASVCMCRPLHSFPNATTMPIRRRNELLDWAESRPTNLVIEDDRPASSCLSDVSVLPLYARSPKHVILVSECRIGASFHCFFAVMPHTIAHHARTRWGDGPFESGIPAMQLLCAAQFIDEGSYARMIARQKKRFEEVVGAFCHVMTLNANAHVVVGSDSSRRLPTLTAPRVIGARVAPYIAVQLPKRYSLSSVVDMMAQRGVMVATTADWGGSTESSGNECLVIDLSDVDKENARRSARMLCDVLADPQACE